MQFDIITIFPNIFDSYKNESILGRAQTEGLVAIHAHDLRNYTTDKHKTVDDSPYGGGVGMVMMVEPMYKAVNSIRKAPPFPRGELEGGVGDGTVHKNETQTLPPTPSLEGRGVKSRIILLTPRGVRFTQKKAQELTAYDQLIFIAGRYEGIDERVAEFVDEQISIGDFVLNGGELPAMIITEAVIRLLPGVLGKDDSSREESFSDVDTIEFPHYTRPEIFTTDDGKELKVPDVLLSGHHAEIKKWRSEQRKK